MTKNHKIIISAIIIIVLFLIYITFDKKSQNKLSEFKDINESQFSTTTNTNVGDYSIEEISTNNIESKLVIPDLNREIVFSVNPPISNDIKKVIEEKVSIIKSELNKNPKSFEGWLNLGIYQKMAGDYEGAKASWIYLSNLYPQSFESLGNLGDLYAYYLKDNGMAETYYKKAISRAPTQSYLYIQLSAVYKDIFKDINKAKAIIEEGLSKIPNDQSLLQIKSNL